MFKLNDPKRWRANEGGLYFFVDLDGTIKEEREDGLDFDDKLYNVGNYFKTVELLKESPIYKAFNSSTNEFDWGKPVGNEVW